MDSVPDVVIDPRGVFKYVSLTLSDGSGSSKTLVRGWSRAEYHDDIFQEVKADLSKKGLQVNVNGGGRINHDPSSKKILVYGYSVAYGQANHSEAVELLKKHYTDYADISFSNEGY